MTASRLSTWETAGLNRNEERATLVTTSPIIELRSPILASRNGERRRVVHVVGQLDMGGMEKLLVEFARHANRDRYELIFLTLSDSGAAADEIRRLGWQVIDLQTKPGLSLRLFVRLARIFRGLKADIVHTHNTRPLIYAGPAARLAGIRRVVHTRHGQRFGASWRETFAFRLAARTTRWFVCVSEDSARISAEEGISQSRIRSQWNGIDLDRFRQCAPVNGPVVSVGRLSPEKDFATLIRATAIAVRDSPDFRLEIAGDGPCATELKQLVTELQLDSNVQFLGRVENVPELLSGASVFALSSQTEGISLTILEAMASGLPVVATLVGGNPEVIVDGETGLLAPPGDPPALADALLQLWRDPNRRRVLGSAGRKRVENYFDVRKMVVAYEQLY